MYKKWLFLYTLHVTSSLLASETNSWTGDINNQLSNANNWSPPISQPAVAGDVASFGLVPTPATSPFLQGGETFSLYQALFSSSSPDYFFQIQDATTLTFGILGESEGPITSGVSSVEPPSTEQLFTINENSRVIFYGTSTANDNANLSVLYTARNPTKGSVSFYDQATAGHAAFQIGGADGENAIYFLQSSTAGNASITLGGPTVSGSGTAAFYESSSAGSSTITVGDKDSSTSYPGTLFFLESSTAGGSQIHIGDGEGLSEVTFRDQSIAGTSSIRAGSPDKLVRGMVSLYDDASADKATILIGDITTNTNSSGALHFYDSSTAGTASLIVGSHLGDSTIDFHDRTTAGQATITAGFPTPQVKDTDGTLTFRDSSSAEQATITISDVAGRSQLAFEDQSIAGSASIYLGNLAQGLSGHASFNEQLTGNPSASNATFVIYPTSSLTFYPGSSGGLATVSLSFGASLEMKGSSSYTLGSLSSESGGMILLNDSTLTLQYEGSSPTTIAGSMSGTGASLVKSGQGTLVLSGSCSYQGPTVVEQGVLVLNTTLSGDLIVLGGTVSGTGSTQDLTISSGLLAPGNSPGTIHVLGNYLQDPSATYLVQIEGSSASSLEVDGTATLNSAPLKIALLDSQFQFRFPYPILSAEQGIVGTFSDPSFASYPHGINLDLLSLEVAYPSNSIVLVQVHPTLIHAASTENQRLTAIQLDGITQATRDEREMLYSLITLTTPEASYALNQLSGQAYANSLFLQTTATQKCQQSVYESLRDTMVKASCKECEDRTLTLWTNGSIGRSILHSKQGIPGLQAESYEVSLGLYKKCHPTWTVGVAGSYEHDTISYKIGAHGSNQTIIASLYSLYRPSSFYLWMDLMGGYSKNRVVRTINGQGVTWHTQGTSKTPQGAFRVEGGYDLSTSYLLCQPFLGIEGEHYHQQKIQETGFFPITLSTATKIYNSANSQLGFHLTLLPSSCLGYLGIDFAWQYLLTSPKESVSVHFQSFGSDFSISGVSLQRNSLLGSLYAHASLGSCWRLFAKASGQTWFGSASATNLLLGIETSW